MSVPAKAAKHSAAGQYLGFSLQPVRLAFHLLSSPARSVCSLEHSDDVATHFADGSHALEQVKSATSKQNPVADWSVDLWKTFANWIDNALSKDAKNSIQYRMYVAPHKTGNMVSKLQLAQTVDDVEAIVKEVKTKLSAEPCIGCADHLKVFVGADPNVRLRVVKNFSLISDTGNPEVDLLKLLVTVPAEYAETIGAWAIGLAKSRTDKLIRAKRPPAIDADWFKHELQAYVRKNYLPACLYPYSLAPEAHEVEALISEKQTFIRQLELVNADPDTLLGAASDFLRASAHKSDWAERGLILDPNYEEWNDSLLKTYKLLGSQLDITNKDLSDEDRGRLLYLRCASASVGVEGQTVPLHFIGGCFNDLANRPILGWHKNYAQLLFKAKGV